MVSAGRCVPESATGSAPICVRHEFRDLKSFDKVLPKHVKNPLLWGWEKYWS